MSVYPRRTNPFPQPQHASRPMSAREQHQPAAAGGDGVGQGSYEDEEAAASRQMLHNTLQRMAQYVRKTRLQMGPFFTDFDPHRQGCVSYAQFARVLATVGFSLTHDIVTNLSDHYALPADPTKVSYKSFQKDVEAVAQAQTEAAHAEHSAANTGATAELQRDFQRSMAERPMIPRAADNEYEGGGGASGGGLSARAPFVTLNTRHPSHAPLTAQKLLHKIQTICSQKRIVLNEIFNDYDPLRKHLVTLQRFRRALDMAGFQLSDAEANILVTAYLSPQDHTQVEYKRFVADVQAPFIPAHAETDPLTTLPPFTPYTMEEFETPLSRFTAAEQERLEALLKEVGYQVHSRRILVRPGFQHHDPNRSGCVTARQFHSVFSTTFPMVRASARDLDLLATKYRRGDVGVCYAQFVKDVEEHEMQASEYARTLHPSHAASAIEAQYGSTRPLEPLPNVRGPQYVAGMRIVGTRSAEEAAAAAAPGPAGSDVLSRISATLSRQRMTVEDLFRDFDPLNKGRVTRAQFFRALTSGGLRLSSVEVQALADQFQHRDIATDVDYRAFTQSLSTIPRF